MQLMIYNPQKIAFIQHLQLQNFASMKHITTAIFLFLFASTICLAQSINPKNNSLSFELGKNGLIYNLTFDHRLQDKDFGLRVAVGSNFAKYLHAVTTGAGAYYLKGRENNLLELGIDFYYLSIDEVSDDQRGVAFIIPNYDIKTFYSTVNVGYRRYTENTLFRIGIAPGITKYDIIPGAYISFGFRF